MYSVNVGAVKLPNRNMLARAGTENEENFTMDPGGRAL